MNMEAEVLVDKAVERLSLRGIVEEQSLRGCTVEEIADIERQTERKLPPVYKSFLKKMGRGAGQFFLGTTIFYPGILDLNKSALELLEEDADTLRLPPEAFVFAMHQGYQFMFFWDCRDDDPAVWYFMEGAGAFEKKYDSFSEFLLESASDDWS